MLGLVHEPRAAAIIGGLFLALCFVYKHHKRRQNRNSPHTIRVSFPEPTPQEDEEKVFKVMQNGVEYFTANAKRSTVVGAGGLVIHFAELAPPTGKETCTIFFLPGWAECMIKYGDFFQDLVEQHNCRVVVLDHRSQGYSQREIFSTSRAANDHLKSHVLDFHDHVTDALLVLNAAINLQDTKLFIMGFSLGGLIATELNKLVPSSGLVLIAPCFHPPIPLLPRAVVRWLARKFEREAFVRGHPTYPDYKMDYPPHNRGTNSLARIKCWEELRRTEENILVTGMSWSQLHALLTPEVECSNKRLLTKRILVLSAELDKLVSNSEIFDFCANRRASGNMYCRHVHFTQSKHGLLSEQEIIRTRAVEEIVQFCLW